MTTHLSTIDASAYVEEYINSINACYQSGEATEHTYRGALATLLSNLLNANRKKDGKDYITIINEPKRREYGAPDFLLKRNELVISFVETKQPGDKDLRGERERVHKAQFDKYKEALSMIATTDFLTFVLFEDAEEQATAQLAKVEGGAIVSCYGEEQLRDFLTIIARLGDAAPQPIRGAKRLAKLMAAKAKLIASILEKAMEKQEEAEDRELIAHQEVLRQFLVHDMSEEQFADFYAQTIIYGMFVARINDRTPKTFSLQEASELIPSINPFLKRIFKLLALANLHSKVKWIVEDLVEIFRVTDMERVLRTYGKDPMVHFYEDFLEEYNPQIREDFGVWYTPEPVVRFIVNAVDDILREEFHIADGLADNSLIEGREGVHRVQILDPATGTGTFLATTCQKIFESYQGQEGLWAEDVVRHIIPRLYGFEYLMAPYTMAHLKLATALQLDKNPHELPERLNIYLTNSLEEDSPQPSLEFARFITDESNAAGSVKRDTPVMVVMGNPPYNEKSANTGDWIMDLMNDYKQEPGQGPIFVRKSRKGIDVFKNSLQEGNPKGINNDYCKFIRLGQSFVERNEEGVVAYITANTYLDSRLFRGMRYNLLTTFDKIYIVNLHGSTMRHENTEEQEDQCVFNIRQGVAIAIFVKSKEQHNPLAKVFYKDLFGKATEKFKVLNDKTLSSIGFTELQLSAPLYTFRIQEQSLASIYQDGFCVDELLTEYVQGLKSDRDNIAMQSTKQEVLNLVQDMLSTKSDEELRELYGFRDNRDWSLAKAKKRLKALTKNEDEREQDKAAWEKYVTRVLFRPFDKRWTLYNKVLITYPRPLLQKSVYGQENIVLCLGQQGNVMGNADWTLAFISDCPTDLNVVPRGGSYLFPLFLYDGMIPKINFAQPILDELEQRTGLTMCETTYIPIIVNEYDDAHAANKFFPNELIDYIYATLFSRKYRATFHDFLQNDFPRIPYPASAAHFFYMANQGARLRSLHLLEDVHREELITKFPASSPTDNNVVTCRRFVATHDGLGQVWINKHQYFDDVPEECWHYILSGYQVLDKWLKDRLGKKLTNDEIIHYQKIVVALQGTIQIQREIDGY